MLLRDRRRWVAGLVNVLVRRDKVSGLFILLEIVIVLETVVLCAFIRGCAMKPCIWWSATRASGFCRGKVGKGRTLLIAENALAGQG